MIESPTASPVIDREVHAPLLRDLDHYAELAGIPAFWIWQPLSPHVPVAVVKWATRFKAQTHGLLLLGPKPGAAEDAMSALVGCLVRNFVDARVRGRESLMEAGSLTRGCTMLAIPDFCRMEDKLRPGLARSIEELLLERYRARKLTVLHARSMEHVRYTYGDAVHDHVRERYVGVPLA